MLIKSGYTASAFAGVIEVENADLQKVTDCLKQLHSKSKLTNTELALSVPEKSIEKYDDYLSESLLTEGYGQKYFDIQSTVAWIKDNL
jgi:ATP-dependent Lhr-like helicase